MIYRNPYNQCPAGSVPYTIRDKDTLGNIASFYNTTVQDIVQFNPGISPNNLQVGQHICVPLKLQMYPSCPTTNYYVVVEGDSLVSIASSFNITAQQLLYSNYGIDPNDLYIDEILCIPVAPPIVAVEINIGEHKLVVYRNGNVLKTYRIGLENPNDPIPRGTFTVVNKQVDPGVERGARWIGLSTPGLGIQGTNNPQFIENISQGHSIILSNRDVSELFNLMPVVTTVMIL
ncbi:LysM peptidoglycan-binding domain-containing protein [Clostridium bowmanii]|uniref:LysM peptidoglycan-binding domain-containing protein n=1 Tax=Clostridium bowmanii TaxID=132925 RepID=UPI001C0BEAC0|nr:LysM peptidoglycan-binding domain-containing protein [Clostridium bowmanii]MBU3189604.1 LysM peptidoglycan-binding domain-containing protein [Clostridium bowmanii]MCA1073552.1 LysM peptidoglycan-binding domain-containing protein [Clostridium bowmanii]